MEFSWPWHFVTPSEEEKILRRELLDLRGSYAQWSIIAVIIVLRVYQGWAKSVTATELTSKQRRGLASWWDRPIAAGWLETRRQYALCGLWLLWLFSLSVWNSGEGMSRISPFLVLVIHVVPLTDSNTQTICILQRPWATLRSRRSPFKS